MEIINSIYRSSILHSLRESPKKNLWEPHCPSLQCKVLLTERLDSQVVYAMALSKLIYQNHLSCLLTEEQKQCY